MSEESTLIKEETVKSTAQSTEPAAETVVNPAAADASNIVPFNSDAPVSDSAPEVSPEALAVNVPAPPDHTPAKTPAAPVNTASQVITEPAAPVNTASQVITEPAAPVHEPPVHTEGSAAKVMEKASEMASSFSDKASDIRDRASDFTDKASAYTEKAADFAGKTAQKAASRIKPGTEDDFPDEDIPEKKRFHFKKDDKEFFRDKWILSRISEENLMDYLRLEQRRSELQQEAKNMKEKRILRAIEMALGLAAIVAVIYLLRDDPSILVNILYIAGILAAFWVWKNPKDK